MRSHVIPRTPMLLVAAANAFVGLGEADGHQFIRWVEMLRRAEAA